MSRRENNRKRKDEARKRRKARNRAAHEGQATPGMGEKTGGRVMFVDKFTGEIREGGAELVDEVFSGLIRERERFVASDNLCYLIGRVDQGEGPFSADEVKKMVDASFKCAIRGSCDAWYANQYALALANSSPPAMADIGSFLCNFELGLRTSGQRAAKHRGKGDWLKESRGLAKRLKDPAAMSGLTEKDASDIVAHVQGHPRFAEAMNWYERCSGKKMSGADPEDGRKDVGGEAGDDEAKDEALEHVIKAINKMTTVFTGSPLQIMRLGTAPVTISRFLAMARNVNEHVNDPLRASLNPVFNRMRMYEEVAWSHARSCPLDESRFLAMLIECRNGYLGQVLQYPSEKSGIPPLYHPIAVCFDPADPDADAVRHMAAKELSKMLKLFVKRMV